MVPSTLARMRLRSESYLLLAAIHCASICSGVSVPAVGAFGAGPLAGVCAAARRTALAATRTAMQAKVWPRRFICPFERGSILNAFKEMPDAMVCEPSFRRADAAEVSILSWNDQFTTLN